MAPPRASARTTPPGASGARVGSTRPQPEHARGRAALTEAVMPPHQRSIADGGTDAYCALAQGAPDRRHASKSCSRVHLHSGGVETLPAPARVFPPTSGRVARWRGNSHRGEPSAANGITPPPGNRGRGLRIDPNLSGAVIPSGGAACDDLSHDPKTDLGRIAPKRNRRRLRLDLPW